MPPKRRHRIKRSVNSVKVPQANWHELNLYQLLCLSEDGFLHDTIRKQSDPEYLQALEKLPVPPPKAKLYDTPNDYVPKFCKWYVENCGYPHKESLFKLYWSLGVEIKRSPLVLTTLTCLSCFVPKNLCCLNDHDKLAIESYRSFPFTSDGLIWRSKSVKSTF